jgi:hypothetical protein
MYSYTVTHSGQLSGVWWRFKTPLEDDQKVAVLVLADDDDDDGDTRFWGEIPSSTDAPKLWGKVSEGDGTVGGEIWCGRPDVNKVEARFYFDLGDSHAYNVDADTAMSLSAGWSNMVELDVIAIQMVPESVTY